MTINYSPNINKERTEQMNDRYNELVAELEAVREEARDAEYKIQLVIEEEFGEAAALEAIANT